MARPAEEMLYVAMEDFRVDIVVGKGPGATAIPLDLPPFTIVGATTRAGMLPGPLRDRFGFTGHLDFYEPAELEQVLRRSAGLLGVQLTDEGGREIARRSRGTPRIANRLLRRVRDWAQVRGTASSTWPRPTRRWRSTRSTRAGLDRLDRAVLEALCTRFGGGPVGLSTLAVAVGEEPETVETVVEPFLVREGLLGRTPRGRVATPCHLAAPRTAPAAARGAPAVRRFRAGARSARTVRRAGTRQAGTRQAGTRQAGTRQAGTRQAGTRQAGTRQAGTRQAGTRQAGTRQAGTRQAGTRQAGTRQAGTARQAGTRQAGTRQAGTRQAGTRQAGTRQAGAAVRRPEVTVTLDSLVAAEADDGLRPLAWVSVRRDSEALDEPKGCQ